MPQDIAFFMPFPERISPDAHGARTRSLARYRRWGLVTDRADQERLEAWDIAGLMARWIPRASGPALDLAVDAVVLIAILDDQFDSPQCREPDQVARICAHFAELCRPASTADPQGPLARAVAQMLNELYRGASADWTWRAGEHYCWYLEACVDEARNRFHRRTPSFDEFIAQRRKAGFVVPMLDLSQKAHGFELPPDAYENPVLARMIEITADFVSIVNDVHSLEKEEARGQERDNLVHVIMHETGCRRDESIARITRMIDAWVREFIDLERQTGTDAVTRQFVDCMRSAIRGYLDWSSTTARYSKIVSAAEPAYGNVL